MKIIILGAGQVGGSLAERLTDENNDITVVDKDADILRFLQDHLDINTVNGDSAHPETLREAGADEADMLIAVTNSDEINMMACQVAHSLFEVPKRIARVRDKSYLNPSYQDLFTSSNLPVNIIISPEKEVDKSVFRRFELSGAIENVPNGDNNLRFLVI